MQYKQFNEVIEAQIQKSLDVLGAKAVEYADNSDRLANFKVAATIQGINPKQALAGMMAKHTYSIFSMIQAAEQDFDPKQWEEKITDSINYLLLLKALVVEDESKKAQASAAPRVVAQSVPQPAQQQSTPPSSATVKTGQ